MATINIDDEVRYIGNDPLPEGIAPDATGSVIMITTGETSKTHLVRFEGMTLTDERLADSWFDPAELKVVIPAAEALRRDLNTLRQEHADLIIERDTLAADRRKLVAALEKIKRGAEWQQGSVFKTWLMASIDEALDDDRPLLDTMLNEEDA